MSYEFNSTTDIIRKGSAALTTTPLTLAAWVIIPTESILVSAGHTFVGVSQSSGSGSGDGYLLRAQQRTAGAHVVRASALEAGVFTSAEATGISGDSWNFICGVFTSSVSRTVYFNSSPSVGSTGESKPVSGDLNETAIGGLAGVAAVSESTAHYVAEAAGWSIALNATQVSQLAAGISPNAIATTALVFYLPLRSDAVDVKNGAWTVTGATLATTHPLITEKGSGALPSQAASLSSSGTTKHYGSGGFGAQSVTVAGRGYPSSASGTGAFASASSTMSGSAQNSEAVLTETVRFVYTKPPPGHARGSKRRINVPVVPIGGEVIPNTGEWPAGDSALAGSGNVASKGDGGFASTSATLSAGGLAKAPGAGNFGSFAVQAASISASGLSKSAGSGAFTSQASSMKSAAAALTQHIFMQQMRTRNVGFQLDYWRLYSQAETSALGTVCGHMRLAQYPAWPLQAAITDASLGSANSLTQINRCITSGIPIIITAFGSGYIYDHSAPTALHYPLYSGQAAAITAARNHLIAWSSYIRTQGWSATQVALELYNEPVVGYAAASFWSNQLADLNAIHAIIPDHMKVVAPKPKVVTSGATYPVFNFEWDWVGGLTNMGPYAGYNKIVCYNTHEYQPMSWTWQGTPTGGSPAGQTYPSGNANYNFFLLRAQRMRTWCDDNSSQMGWIGETGSDRYPSGGAYGTHRVACERDQILAARAVDFPVTIFDDSAIYASTNRGVTSWFSHISSATWNIHGNFHANFALTE